MRLRATVLLVLALAALAPAAVRAQFTYGDTLTAIMRPLVNLPEMVVTGEAFDAWVLAPANQTGFTARLELGANTHALPLEAATYDASRARFTLRFRLPADVPEELYDLVLSAPGLATDRAVNAVQVLAAEPHDYYFVQVSDTHLVTDLYYYETGADTDTSEVADFRAVIDDLNIIQPAFVLHTGDLVNEGEIEEFLNRYYWSRSQALFGAFEMPFYLVSGNHDIGGWDATPPPDGTARRNWWRYFGWPWLDNPPAGDPLRTQNYTFDLGDVRYFALEAYINYDDWRQAIYGAQSFISEQLSWLAQNVAATPPTAAKVAFFHYDFSNQIHVAPMGLDMALWGHNHGVAEGNWQTPPYDLGLQSVCDGRRKFRLVRAGGRILAPRPMLASGPTGDNLRLAYSTQNGAITATVVNVLPEPFERAEVRFRVPDDATTYELTGGTLLRVIREGGDRVYYARLFVPASGTVAATLTPVQTGIAAAGSPPAAFRLGPALPNPFNPATTIRVALPAAGRARLDVVDLLGRRVRRLHDGPLAAGTHAIPWDGRNEAGRPVPSGTYVVRCTSRAGDAELKVIRVK